MVNCSPNEHIFVSGYWKNTPSLRSSAKHKRWFVSKHRSCVGNCVIAELMREFISRFAHYAAPVTSSLQPTAPLSRNYWPTFSEIGISEMQEESFQRSWTVQQES